jgi:hypothetical protein
VLHKSTKLYEMVGASCILLPASCDAGKNKKKTVNWFIRQYF